MRAHGSDPGESEHAVREPGAGVHGRGDVGGRGGGRGHERRMQEGGEREGVMEAGQMSCGDGPMKGDKSVGEWEAEGESGKGGIGDVAEGDWETFKAAEGEGRVLEGVLGEFRLPPPWPKAHWWRLVWILYTARFKRNSPQTYSNTMDGEYNELRAQSDRNKISQLMAPKSFYRVVRIPGSHLYLGGT